MLKREVLKETKLTQFYTNAQLMAPTLKCSVSTLSVSMYLGTSSNFEKDQDDVDKLVNLIISLSCVLKHCRTVPSSVIPHYFTLEV